MKRALISCLIACLPASLYAQEDSANAAQPAAATDNTIIAAAPVPERPEHPQRDVSDHPYKLHYAVDIPVALAGVVWCPFAFSKIYDKPQSTVAEIAALNRDNIPSFDRWAAGMHSEQAANTSDLFFYGSVATPFLLLLDKKVRHDAPKVGFLYLETMSVTGILYTGATFFVDRYRPETYSDDKTAAEKLDGNYKNAFFAGHPAVVSSTTFFAASIYDQYHPHSPFKWVLYGAAATATLTTAYLRHKAGKHFPSDLVLGCTVGTASGMIIPRLHRRKDGRQAFMITPYMNDLGSGYGLTMTYHLK